MTVTAMNDLYRQAIEAELSSCLTETDYRFGAKYRGKVRDSYDLGDKLVIVTTDRQSAFDRYLASVPYKGQVLNQTAAWWFEKTKDIVPNHFLASPDPNVSLVKKCKVFPIEFVVRGYITGTTNTSLWTQYNKGLRQYCGLEFPEGLKKNQPLPHPVITPTTKETEHDRPISAEEIVSEGFMSQADWEAASEAALKLYQRGAELAAQHGLILVDTKYEFGKDQDGQLTLVDEVHTPDSSRYWLADSYPSRYEQGLEPENIDKEFLRLWFIEHCDPYKDEHLPEAPRELIITLASRYIQLYEMITGKSFEFPETAIPPQERIEKNIQKWLEQFKG